MKEVFAKNETEFPVCLTGEPTKIRVYRETKHARERFVLTHYDCRGERQRRTFGTFEEAEAAGLKLKKETRSGGWDLVTLRGTERLSHQRAVEMLRPLGIPLDVAVTDFVRARQVLGGDHIVEAARFYRSHQSAATLPHKTVPEVFAELLANRRANGKSRLYLKDLQLRLGRFADAFKGPISAVTTRDIDLFLFKLKVKGRTRLNFRQTIGVLLSYDNDLYRTMLGGHQGWTHRVIETSTRGVNGRPLQRTELVWMNKHFTRAVKVGRPRIRLSPIEVAENKLNPERF